MSDAKPGPTVPNALRDETDYGRMTHIERINLGSNPADGTGASPGTATGAPPKPADPADYGPQRLYRQLVGGFHDGMRVAAGTTIALYAHEVGAHHELIGEKDGGAPEPEHDYLGASRELGPYGLSAPPSKETA